MALTGQFLSLVAAVLAVPSIVFFIEVMASVVLSGNKRDAMTTGERKGVIAVLVPAHNEEKGLEPTLTNIKEQLRPGDQLVVVADNCSDETASVAANAGAMVTVRNNLSRIGKGYALDWGLTFLAVAPPDIVVVIDADCQIAAGSLDRLAALSEQQHRPVQGLYLMSAPNGSAINHQVATFAWRLKNWMRPLGLKALGLPCQLMGTGMAFPWSLIRSTNLSSSEIVEDLKLGLDLARAGCAPIFCPSAIVTSNFPQTIEGSKAQRQRWEQGHVSLILTKAVPLLVLAIRQRNPSLFALVLDLLVPPLSLLILLLTAAALASALAVCFGASPIPLLLNLSGLCVIALGIIFAWSRHAQDILPPAQLGLIPRYIFAKLWLYLATLFGRKISSWVRADRN